jgi:hypothetical protein
MKRFKQRRTFAVLMFCVIFAMMITVWCKGWDRRRFVMLQPPVWRVGDWFVVRESLLAAVMMPDERLPWSEPFTVKASVIREEEVFGYPCFVLKVSDSPKYDETWEFLYYFRQRDMNLLKYNLAIHNRFGVTESEELGAPGPWGRDSLLLLGAYPMFPVMSGEQAEETGLKTKAGELVVHTSWRTHGMRQAAGQEPVKIMEDKKSDVVRIQVYNKDHPDDVMIMRWLPGKIWWVQCWNERPFRHSEKQKRMEYRASLAATSLDVVPADEITKVLPSHIGEWKMQMPHPMDLPNHLWHLLSNYRRMQTVAYQNNTGKQLLLWIFPNSFDEDKIAGYEKMDAAERGTKGLPNLLAQGENYRICTAIVPQQEEIERVLEGVKEAVARHLKVRLEEYPLPKAGTGGKILEH